MFIFSKSELEMNKPFKESIVTEITQATMFYPAEDYHQNYYKDNPRQGYCRVIIDPKVAKFRKMFADKLK